MSLRTKFLLAFLVLTLTPLLAFGAISFYLVNRTHHEDITKIQQQYIDLNRSEILRFFQEDIFAQNLNIVVPRSQVSLPLNCELEPLFQQTFDLTPALQEVTLIAAVEGRPISDPEQCKESGISETVPVGKELISSIRGGQLSVDASRYHADTEKFKQASAGQNYISAPYATLSGPMVTVAAPAYNKPPEGEKPTVLFVTTAEVALKPLVEDLVRQRLGETGYFMLLSETGNVIAFPENSALEGRELFPKSAFAERILSEKTSLVRTSDVYRGMQGKEVLGAATHIPEIGNWIVIAEWPVEEANAILPTILWQIALFTMASAIALVLASFVVARAVIGPVRILAKGAEEIGRGNFEQKLSVHTGDELEELSDTFNEMAKGLKRLDELRKEFVFIATHELRAPATAIKGYLDLIREAGVELPKTVEMPFQRIKQVNDNLVHLVDDLLEIARAEAGRLTVDVSPQELPPIVDEIVASLKVVAEPRKISLVIEPIQTPFPKVTADPDKLREVLMNLISNAIKYNRDGGSVTVRLETKGQEILTHVLDTGLGIGAEEQKHLFEKFWRSDDPDVRKQTGTGLGLFIVKEIVERMDGKIWAVSEKGKGTTFSFSLKIA